MNTSPFFGFNIQVFEPFGAVELVQLPTDPDTGNCKGYGFIQVSMGLSCLLAFINVKIKM